MFDQQVQDLSNEPWNNLYQSGLVKTNLIFLIKDFSLLGIVHWELRWGNKAFTGSRWCEFLHFQKKFQLYASKFFSKISSLCPWFW